MLSPSFNARVPALAQVCGRTLLIAFAVSVFFAVFPLQIGSSVWGTQLSSRIIDRVFIALVGVTLLCAAAFLQPMPEDLHTASRMASKLGRQRRLALRLCGIGMISMALLASWQLLLMLNSMGQINEGVLSQSSRISPTIETAERLGRQAPAPQLEQSWKRFLAAGAPGVNQPVSINSAEQKRQALLSAINDSGPLSGIYSGGTVQGIRSAPGSTTRRR
ncbi:MAG: hypothetical protein VKM98_01620 [Cyanobacteriota bacterium]|nr:hypothetical protein [Cyanobacteriota bacterium]